jgi:hypothetical protein
MKAGIVIDAWKSEIFARHLKTNGYDFKSGPRLTPDTLLLQVETPNAQALETVVRAANTEAAKTGEHHE